MRGTSEGRGPRGMPLVYGGLGGVLALTGLVAFVLPGVAHESVPEVDREAREDDPLGRVEQVEPVETEVADRRRRVDLREARRRLARDQVTGVDGLRRLR